MHITLLFLWYEVFFILASIKSLIVYSQTFQRWPEAEFHVVPDAGHFHTEIGIQAKIMEAAKKYEHL